MRRGSAHAVETVQAGAVSRQALGRLAIQTPGPSFTDLTAEAARFVADSGIAHGLLTVFCRHTSASLTIQENADPDVQTDLLTALDRLAPRDAGYRHGIEGPDDMPAHIRAMLTGASLAVPGDRRPSRARPMAGSLPRRASRPSAPAGACPACGRRLRSRREAGCHPGPALPCSARRAPVQRRSREWTLGWARTCSAFSADRRPPSSSSSCSCRCWSARSWPFSA